MLKWEVVMFMQSPASRWILALLALICAPILNMQLASAQSTPQLRPGERIDVPGGSVSVLGIDIQPGNNLRVTVRMRAIASAQRSMLIDLEAFRLIAGGVPRAPEYATTAERQMSSFLVEKDSATDFTRVFVIPDKTDDLILQIRIGGATERRRLSGS
jgi:hypothetical protein